MPTLEGSRGWQGCLDFCSHTGAVDWVPSSWLRPIPVPVCCRYFGNNEQVRNVSPSLYHCNKYNFLSFKWLLILDQHTHGCSIKKNIVLNMKLSSLNILFYVQVCIILIYFFLIMILWGRCHDKAGRHQRSRWTPVHGPDALISPQLPAYCLDRGWLKQRMVQVLQPPHPSRRSSWLQNGSAPDTAAIWGGNQREEDFSVCDSPFFNSFKK